MSERKHQGEVTVDHRASPGIPAELAERMGYHPSQVAEGKLFEAATQSCYHCGGVVVLNPLRTRERGHCFKCNRYICDLCVEAMRAPDYVHLPVKAIVDLVQSGKVTVGGTSVNPLLIPTPRKGDSNG